MTTEQRMEQILTRFQLITIRVQGYKVTQKTDIRLVENE